MASSNADLGGSLLRACTQLCEVAAKAERNGKSLSGGSFYGEKFHAALIELAKVEGRFLALIDAAQLNVADVSDAKAFLATIKSTAPMRGKRSAALRSLNLFFHGPAANALSDHDLLPSPSNEAVLPKAVVVPAKKSYLINVVVQANQCYESRCHDACAVMIRKLVEILIIELYEARALEAEVKGSNGDYVMLSGLIDAVLKAPHWNLSRDTKSTLPKLKALGDRAAHNRRFLATTGDINPIIPGLRVVVDDLLHLAGLK
jgi:hypothetical protein